MQRLSELASETPVIDKVSGWISTVDILEIRIRELSQEHINGDWYVAKPCDKRSWEVGDKIIIDVRK